MCFKLIKFRIKKNRTVKNNKTVNFKYSIPDGTAKPTK